MSVGECGADGAGFGEKGTNISEMEILSRTHDETQIPRAAISNSNDARSHARALSQRLVSLSDEQTQKSLSEKFSTRAKSSLERRRASSEGRGESERTREHTYCNNLSFPTQSNRLDDFRPNSRLFSLILPMTECRHPSLVDRLHRGDLLDGLLVIETFLDSRISIHFCSFRLQSFVGHDLARRSSGSGGVGVRQFVQCSSARYRRQWRKGREGNDGTDFSAPRASSYSTCFATLPSLVSRLTRS